MPITYSNIDKRFWFYQPQLTRWRMPFRGSRSSLRINQETSQIAYDIYKIAKRNDDLKAIVKDFSATIVDGIDYSISLDSSGSPDVILIGISEMASRIEGLRNRIRGLE